MLKKFLSLMLSAVLCASLLAAAFAEEASGEKVLYYPDFMAESEGETLVLEQEPQRIACLSNAALQVLARCGITPVVITSLSASAEFPEWVYELPTVTVGVNGMGHRNHLRLRAGSGDRGQLSEGNLRPAVCGRGHPRVLHQRRPVHQHEQPNKPPSPWLRPPAFGGNGGGNRGGICRGGKSARPSSMPATSACA